MARSSRQEKRYFRMLEDIAHISPEDPKANHYRIRLQTPDRG
jgi:hypothetical protein